MRAAVLHGVGDIRLESRPLPVPGPGEVLLKVSMVGVCGSDLHFYTEGRSGSAVVTGPTVLGHEFGGKIVDVGEGVPGDRIGERVTVEPGSPCQQCRSCRRGTYNHCERMRFIGAATIDGAMQEYLAVPAPSAFAIADEVSDGAAALIEPLSVAVHAVGRVPLEPQQHVLVIGAGPIGQLVAQLAHSRGATHVWLCDPNTDRLGHASHPVRTTTPEAWRASQQRVDIVFECSGSSTALTTGLASIRPQAALVVVGVGPQTVELPIESIQEGELTIVGSHRYHHTWPEAIGLVERGQIDLDALITHTYPLDEVAAALEVTRNDRTALKALVQL